MSTQLGIISDPHAAPAALEHALSVFKQRNIETIICAGDIAGYFDNLAATVALLKLHKVQCIIGNHDQDYLAEAANAGSDEFHFLKQLPVKLELMIEGKRIYVVHAHPPDMQHGGIKLLDLDGSVIEERKTHWQNLLGKPAYDILIVGHTHQVFAQQAGKVLIINPGSTVFNHSAVVLTLPEMQVDTIALEHRDILKCWNWGMFVRGL